MTYTVKVLGAQIQVRRFSEEAYSEPCQTSEMELLRFAKSFISKVLQGFQYVAGLVTSNHRFIHLQSFLYKHLLRTSSDIAPETQ